MLRYSRSVRYGRSLLKGLSNIHAILVDMRYAPIVMLLLLNTLGCLYFAVAYLLPPRILLPYLKNRNLPANVSKSFGEHKIDRMTDGNGANTTHKAASTVVAHWYPSLLYTEAVSRASAHV